jgi:chorismate synthase
MGSSFGKIFTISTFGESHGAALGVVIDGCLPNIEVDFDLIQRDLQRRKPGQSKLSSPRQEAEDVDILSGVFEGKTLGTPITLLVKNTDVKSADYTHIKDIYRPSHADFTYDAKYGIRDYRGGGRQSARETVARVLAGSFAKMILNKLGIHIQAYVSQIHTIQVSKSYLELDLAQTESNLVRCPDSETAAKMEEAILKAKAEGDSLGGIISCVVKGLPVGLGEPVFDKLHADLGKAMLSINAVKGFDIGSGFESVLRKGSELNDSFTIENHSVRTKTNHSGGVQGGISNGEDIYFRVAFKPVASIKSEQESITKQLDNVKFSIDGRHDSCVVPRAVPIVEAMAALVIVDHYLRNASYKMQAFS